MTFSQQSSVAMEEADSWVEPRLGRFKTMTVKQRMRTQGKAMPITPAKERR